MTVERDPSLEPRSLAGATAVVTGASRGIGFAIARSLVGRGAHVALFARNRERLEAAAAELGSSALPVAVDVGDPASVRAGFARVHEARGGLDVLVNNAGIAGLGRIEDITDDDLRREIDTNLLGAVHCSRAAIPLLRAAGGGDIVNVSSSSVADPYPYLSIYAATKAALEMFSVALRREVKADGTRVIVMRLGPSWTTFNEAWDAGAAEKAFAVWQEQGYAGWDGSMDPEIAGESVARALELPPQAGMDYFEIAPTAKAPTEPVERK